MITGTMKVPPNTESKNDTGTGRRHSTSIGAPQISRSTLQVSP
jgi:hypothetical protein